MEDQNINQEKEEKKDDEKKNKNEHKKPEYKEFFLYFIETHPDEKSLKIDLVKNENATNIEKVKEDSANVDDVNYTIHKLKIIASNNLKKLKIKFKLTDSDNHNFESEIELKEFSHDYFLYDFNYVPDKKAKVEIENYAYKLSLIQQFNFFYNYLESDANLETNSPEFSGLLLSTKKKLIISNSNKDKNKQNES